MIELHAMNIFTFQERIIDTIEDEYDAKLFVCFWNKQSTDTYYWLVPIFDVIMEG